MLQSSSNSGTPIDEAFREAKKPLLRAASVVPQHDWPETQAADWSGLSSYWSPDQIGGRLRIRKAVTRPTYGYEV